MHGVGTSPKISHRFAVVYRFGTPNFRGPRWTALNERAEDA